MKRFILFVPVLFILASVHAQSGEGKTLEECLKYAVEHQTNLRQSVIDQQITERQIKYQLAEWYPQIGFSGTLQHNFQKQTSIFNNTANPVGTSNVSGGYFGLNQTIFNRNVVIAQQSARDVRLSAKQNTINTQIEVVANVSKAFYDLLLSHEQISLLDTDIVLLERSLKDAFNQYKSGLVDKTDYQRATISLNNAKAGRKIAEEQMKAKIAILKVQMSFPVDSFMEVRYDTTRMREQVLALDTSQLVDVNNRIEFQQLVTQKRLQEYLDNIDQGFAKAATQGSRP